MKIVVFYDLLNIRIGFKMKHTTFIARVEENRSLKMEAACYPQLYHLYARVQLHILDATSHLTAVFIFTQVQQPDMKSLNWVQSVLLNWPYLSCQIKV